MAGLLGVGGGVIFLPSLLFLLPAPNSHDINSPLIPIATSLFAGTFASVTAAVNQIIATNVAFREAFIIPIASITAAFLLPKLVIKVDPATLKYIISFVLLIVAVDMALKSDKIIKPRLLLSKRYLIPAGIVTGIFSAMTGLGGGIIIVPLLIYIFGMETKRAIGTSVLVVAFTMLASTLSYATVSEQSLVIPGYTGYINLHAGLLLGVSSVLGALLGVNLNLNIKTARIKKYFLY